MESGAIDGVEWRISSGLISYPDAVAEMDARAAAIRAGEAAELVWLLEHPALYTQGTSADVSELLAPDRFPVYRTGRGGRFTYHGPGQRVGYIMLDLEKRGRDVRGFVASLEGWLIDAVSRIGIVSRRAPGRIGIWVDRDGGGEAKIGAIGVRIRRWVTTHGFALNLDPDLSHFSGIVPCGLAEYPVTSIREAGLDIGMAGVDAALKAGFPDFLDRLGGHEGP